MPAVLLCLVESQIPTGEGKGGTIEVKQCLKVGCILYKVEIMCRPDQKAVRKFVNIANNRVKSASLSSVAFIDQEHLTS